MPREYLLDTSIAVSFLRNVPVVRRQVAAHTLRFLPFVTAAELLVGARLSDRREINFQQCSAFLGRFAILYPGHATTGIYSDLYASLLRQGRLIPQNDLWLASLTLEHDAVLVTSDKHFAAIPRLRTENWLV